MKESWITYFFDICKTVASKSKDASSKVGCVIVGKEHNILSTGYNGFPRGVEEQPERNERPMKYTFTEHAERNAIYNAARHGVRLEGSILFVQGLPPCTDCARAIIQCGIKEVYVSHSKVFSTYWHESWIFSVGMFEEAGVKINIFDNECVGVDFGSNK
jgi:dCMP deaminase